MLERSKEVPLLHRLLLAAGLGLLFLVSAGVEEPAEEGCCDVLVAEAVRLRVVFSPKSLDPASWGKTYYATVQLISTGSGEPVGCDLDLVSTGRAAGATWNLVKVDDYAASLSLTVPPWVDVTAAKDYTTREAYLLHVRKGALKANAVVWDGCMELMKKAEWALAADTFMLQSGDLAAVVRATRTGDTETVSGVFRARLPVEELIPAS